MKQFILKLLGLPIYKKGDRFVFEGVGKFKIIGDYRHRKSYDCEFYEFDKGNNEMKTYKIISEIEIKTNILIHKIDNFYKNGNITIGNMSNISNSFNNI